MTILEIVYYRVKNSADGYGVHLDQNLITEIPGRRKRVRNCAPNIYPDDDFHKLSGEKEILKIGQDLADL